MNNTTIPIINTPISIPAQGTPQYTASFIISSTDVVADELRECLPADAAGHGLFNLATLTSGGLVLNDDACTDLPALRAYLTLIKQVMGESSPLWTLATPDQWLLQATDTNNAVVVSGAGTTSRVEVDPGTFTLSEEAIDIANNPDLGLYAQQGEWSCVTTRINDAPGAEVTVPVTDGQLAITEGDDVTCVIRNATGHLTMLKYADSQWAPTSAWSLTATPGSEIGLPGDTAGLPVTTVNGAFNPSVDNTVTVMPGHEYTVTEALSDPASNIDYFQFAFEEFVPAATTTVNGVETTCEAAMENPDALAAGFPHPENGEQAWSNCWTAATEPIVVDPSEHAIYRFVNAANERPPLPLTGASSQLVLTAGAALSALLLLAYAWRRTNRSATTTVLLTE